MCIQVSASQSSRGGCSLSSVCVCQRLAIGFLSLIFMGNWPCSTCNQRAAGDGEEGWKRWYVEGKTEVNEACPTYFFFLPCVRILCLVFIPLSASCFSFFPSNKKPPLSSSTVLSYVPRRFKTSSLNQAGLFLPFVSPSSSSSSSHSHSRLPLHPWIH